jgi:hypothetical protein
MKRVGSRGRLSAENQPSGVAKSEGKRKAREIRTFRQEFLSEILSAKLGEKYGYDCLKEGLCNVIKTDMASELAHRRFDKILKMIDVLSPKDFDLGAFSEKCKIFLGDENHPLERELVGGTDSETN